MSSSRKRRLMLALLLLLLGSTALCIYWHYESEARLARAQELSQQLRGAEGRKLSADERKEKWQALRDEMARLSPGQKRVLARERRKGFNEKLANYFALSKSQKRAHLDAEIRKMESGRKRGAGQGGAGANRAGGGQATGDRTALSAADRERRKKDYLDMTTPQERAQTTQYFTDLNARRRELGLRTFGTSRIGLYPTGP